MLVFSGFAEMVTNIVHIVSSATNGGANFVADWRQPERSKSRILAYRNYSTLMKFGLLFTRPEELSDRPQVSIYRAVY